MRLFGLAPALVAGLVVVSVAVLAALHVLRIRPARLQVPTLLFWRAAAEETRARSLFHRFRHPRTFAFLALLATALVLAAAAPETESGLLALHHEVIVFDLSASMGAREEGGGPSRLDRARAAALAWLDRVPLAHPVAIVFAEWHRTTATGFDLPRVELRRLLRTASPGAAAADLPRSLRVAASLLAGRPNPHLVVFSDRLSKLEPALAGLPATVLKFSGRLEDDAIAGVSFGRELEVRITSRGTPRARRIVIGNTDDPDLVVPVEAGAPGDRWITVPGLWPDGSDISVWLLPHDSIRGNDVLFYRLPLQPSSRVFIADDPDGLLKPLLLSLPSVTLTDSTAPADLVIRVKDGEVALAPSATVIRMPHGNLLSDVPIRPPFAGLPGRGLAPDPAARTLLRAGEADLMQLVVGPPRELLVADGVARKPGGFLEDPAKAALVLDALRDALGIQGGSAVLPSDHPSALLTGGGGDGGSRADAPLTISAHAGAWTPVTAFSPFPNYFGEPERLGLWDTIATALDPLPDDDELVTGTTPIPVPPARLRLWEWIAGVVFLLSLIDAWLHQRGTIP